MANHSNLILDEMLARFSDLQEIRELDVLMRRLAAECADLAGYGAALLTVATPDGTRVAGHKLSDAELQHFRTRAAGVAFEERMANRARIRALAFPGTSIAFIRSAPAAGFNVVPTPEVRLREGEWSADDTLYVFMRGRGGEDVGLLSLDSPLDGQRPREGRLERLMAVEQLLALGSGLIESAHYLSMLEVSEERFRQIAETIDVIFWLREVAPERLLYVNPAYERVWGRTQASLYEDPDSYLEQVHPEDRASARRVLGGDSTEHVEAEFRLIRPDEQAAWIHAQTFPTQARETGGRRTVSIARDMTREKDLEGQLHHAQRLESIGRLAGGISHDFNNLLTVILSSADLLIHRTEARGEHHRELHQLREAGRRAATLTSGLLAFARRQVFEPTLLDLNELVAGLEPILHRLVGEPITLVTKLADPAGKVHADGGQVEQVLMNLVVNARDALPDGGTITLKTEIVRLDEAYVARHADSVTGDFVMLAVSDTGSGMSDEVKMHIFEPFFTTKEAGVGTGLGLATAYGIVRQSSGHIWVESEPGRGSTFRCYFPLVEGEVPSSTPRAYRAASGGREVILVVEDDDLVRDVARRSLESRGYTVLEAGNGQDALRLLSSTSAQVELLLTDVMMPGLTGPQLAAALRETHPDLRVLYTSGYAADEIARGGELDAEFDFLPKPYVPADLALAVRSALDRR